MVVIIEDDFDLQKIKESGQCFRIKVMKDGSYRFITGTNILYIKDLGNYEYEATCGVDEWDTVWYKYFNLDRDYCTIRNELYDKYPYLDDAIEYSKGIRILRQNPFETLISFILSQRKSIKAIESCVDNLCECYGSSLVTIEEEGVSLFPNIFQLKDVQIEDYKELSFGYRAEYVYETVQSIYENHTVLSDLEGCTTEELLKQIQKYKGVGIKVANCVGLFGFGRLDCIPVDTWINKSIVEDFGGKDIFKELGSYAGLAQQYIYMYKRVGK